MKRTGIDSRVPVAELFVGDLVVGLNRIALVTSDNLVIFVTVLGNAGLGGKVTIVGGLGDGGSGLGTRNVDADVVV